MYLNRIHFTSTVLLLLACNDSSSTTSTAPDSAGSGSSAPAAVASTGPSGLTTDEQTGELVFRTDAIALPVGQESYTCFAATLAQDEIIDGFKKGTQGFVHHIQFAKTLDGAEPSGLSQCDVLFKINWMPVFLAGAGSSELRLDEGVGHKFPAGTQLIAQLHLLNAGNSPINEQVEIRMHRSASADPIPVSTWAIGSSQINVPPRQAGQAQNVCTVKGDVELVAAFPHMHMIGKRMLVEVGKTIDAMSMLYARDPFDFDDQHMEKLKISLKDGDIARVTCDYMNTLDTTAGFGESSLDEMCFFIGFAIGDPPWRTARISGSQCSLSLADSGAPSPKHCWTIEVRC